MSEIRVWEDFRQPLTAGIRHPNFMTLYVLICLSLSLAGVAGLQFFYLAYLERMDKLQKKSLRELESHNRRLKQRLYDTELQIARQAELIEAVYDDFEEEEEVWADVIEDR